MDSRLITVAVVFGTRPDTIKLAPVIRMLKEHPDEFRVVSIATAQHRQMLDQVLEVFGIEPDYDLDIMLPRQSLEQVTTRGVERLGRVFARVKPDVVLVQGDTTTTFLGSLVAFYQHIPVGHVEAGLRTDDRYNPFPEEINRRLTSTLANYHFAPTLTAKQALMAENIPPKHIYVTGNTVIDALKHTIRNNYVFKDKILQKVASLVRESHSRLILITTHRRENWGEPMRAACRAIRRLTESKAGKDVIFTFPVHLNPVVRDVVYSELHGVCGVHLIAPLQYHDFVNLMNLSYFIITDSGGVQEEAPSLGKPVLVMRRVTERPEAVKAGTARLVGLDEERIFKTAYRLLGSEKEYCSMASVVNPYGDGMASRRIVEVLRYEFGLRQRRPEEFHGSDAFI
jgi:UDP-N-acetylglucosamine 2-epimerase (non-hydrolysing)